jgi:hypothetical protein
MRLLLPLLALIAAPVAAQTSSQAAPTAAPASPEIVAAMRSLQADDARLQTIGWRLATANAPLCPEIQSSVGLLLQDVANFRVPATARSALGIGGDFAVEAVASDSPAASAGLVAGEEVLAVDGQDLASLPPVKPGDYARLVNLHDQIDAALTAKGSVPLRLKDREVALPGHPACRTRFELLTDGDRAVADGRRVLVSRRFLAMATTPDEAAFPIAHELAHNILRHRVKLAASGRTVAAIRDTEREADRLGLWLMANAGYDPAAALSFMRRYGPRGLLALFQEPTHDSAEARERMLAEELAVLRATPVDQTGLRDWRTRFISVTEPPNLPPSASAP